MPTESDWAQARDRMLLDPAVAYLNSGSAKPLPRSVYERVSGLRWRLTKEPPNFLLREGPDLLYAACKRLAEFVGGDPSRFSLTSSRSTRVMRSERLRSR